MSILPKNAVKRRAILLFAGLLYVSGLVSGQSPTRLLPGLDGSPTPTATPENAKADANPEVVSPEEAESLLEAAEAEGQEAFSERTGAEPDEYAEYLQLLGLLAGAEDVRTVRSIATPEFLAESERIEQQIAQMQTMEEATPATLAQFDETRVAAELARTWATILADFSRGESDREQAAFERLRQEQLHLQGMEPAAELTGRAAWERELQALRMSVALAAYENAQDSTLRDAEQKLEAIKARAADLDAARLQDRVTFPEEYLEQQIRDIGARQSEASEEGVRAAEALRTATDALASTRPDSNAARTLEVRVASLQRQVEANSYVRLLLNRTAQIWQNRFTIWNADSAEEFLAARDAVENLLRDIQQWQSLVNARVRDIRRADAQVAQQLGLPQGAELPAEIAQFFSAESAGAARLESAVENLGTLAMLTRLDIQDRTHGIPLSEQVARTVAQVRGIVAGVWEFELFELKDTTTINGQVVERSSSVTIGMIVVALLILGIGISLSSRVCRWFAARLQRRFRLEDNTAVVVEKLSHYLAVAILVLVALGIVRIPLTIFALLGGATAIAIGFGAQQLFNNLISGVILLFEKPIRIGDRIEVVDYSGIVTSIGSRCSRLRRPDGVEILIPNSVILQNSLINWTLSDKLCRLELHVGVAYGSDIELAAKLVREALEEHPHVLKNPPPMVLFDDFGDSALALRSLYWIDSAVPNAILGTPSELRFVINRKLANAGIGIPFPQRDVHLDASKPIPVQIQS